MCASEPIRGINEMKPEEFKEAVMSAKEATPEYQIRFLAFVTHNGGDAWKGNVAVRNAKFIAWINDRKREYEIAYPGATNPGIDGSTILNQAHFTNFIVSGEWL